MGNPGSWRFEADTDRNLRFMPVTNVPEAMPLTNVPEGKRRLARAPGLDPS